MPFFSKYLHVLIEIISVFNGAQRHLGRVQKNWISTELQITTLINYRLLSLDTLCFDGYTETVMRVWRVAVGGVRTDPSRGVSILSQNNMYQDVKIICSDLDWIQRFIREFHREINVWKQIIYLNLTLNKFSL